MAVRNQSRVVTFFVAFIIWMILCWELSAATIVIGLGVAFLVSVVSGHLFTEVPSHWLEGRRYGHALIYVGVFLKKCIQANMDVALRVIRPDMPINPGIVKVHTTLNSEAGLTFLANSITLTPGTLSVDIDKDEKVLYIHWIDVKNKDPQQAGEIIVKEFEDIIRKVLE